MKESRIPVTPLLWSVSTAAVITCLVLLHTFRTTRDADALYREDAIKRRGEVEITLDNEQPAAINNQDRRAVSHLVSRDANTEDLGTLTVEFTGTLSPACSEVTVMLVDENGSIRTSSRDGLGVVQFKGMSWPSTMGVLGVGPNMTVYYYPTAIRYQSIDVAPGSTVEGVLIPRGTLDVGSIYLELSSSANEYDSVSSRAIYELLQFAREHSPALIGRLTDKAGHFGFCAVPSNWSGWLRLPARLVFDNNESEIPVAASNGFLSLKVRELAAVRGVLLLDGKPAGSVGVNYSIYADTQSSSGRVRTDSSGAFTIHLRPIGAVRMDLAFASDECALLGRLTVNKISAEEGRDLGAIVLDPCSQTRVHVIDEDRHAVENAYIVDDTTQGIIGGPTDSAGYGEIPRAAFANSHLFVGAAGYSLEKLDAGEPITNDVTVSLHKVTRLNIEILMQHGDRPKGAQLILQVREPGEEGWKEPLPKSIAAVLGESIPMQSSTTVASVDGGSVTTTMVTFGVPSHSPIVVWGVSPLARITVSVQLEGVPISPEEWIVLREEEWRTLSLSCD